MAVRAVGSQSSLQLAVAHFFLKITNADDYK